MTLYSAALVSFAMLAAWRILLRRTSQQDKLIHPNLNYERSFFWP